MRVLNIGGGPSRELMPHLKDFEQHLLDIDANVRPDICCDVLQLQAQRPDLAGAYDAVFSSHVLEHFYQHDVAAVLSTMAWVLKPGGSIDLVVPDVMGMVRDLMQRNLDLHDTWYRTGEGNAITFHDTLFGWGRALRAGNMHYAHKCAFSPVSLDAALKAAGFMDVGVGARAANLYGKGVKPCQ